MSEPEPGNDWLNIDKNDWCPRCLTFLREHATGLRRPCPVCPNEKEAA